MAHVVPIFDGSWRVRWSGEKGKHRNRGRERGQEEEEVKKNCMAMEGFLSILVFLNNSFFFSNPLQYSSMHMGIDLNISA